MLANHLEKNVYRKIVLCEQMYKSERIEIQYYVNVFQIFRTTLLTDIEDIVELLEDTILDFRKDKQYVYLKFNPEIPLYEIRKRIYRKSLFLKTCAMFVGRRFNYLDLVQQDFISVSKAYLLKDRAVAFFENIGLSQQAGQLTLSEFQTRLLSIYFSTKIDVPELPQPTLGYQRACKCLLDFIEQHFFATVFSPENRYFLEQGLYLAYHRHTASPIDIDLDYIVELKRRPMYDLVKSYWEESSLSAYLPDSELVFVVSLFTFCEYSAAELNYFFYQYVEKTQETYLNQRQDVVRLIERFEETFEMDLMNNTVFKKAIIHLTRSAWRNYQFLVHEHFYPLGPENREIATKIKRIIIQWEEENGHQLVIARNLIHRFANEVSHVLEFEKPSFDIKIVTDSHIKFIAYKEFFEQFQIFDFTIEQRMYRSLKEATHQTKKNSNQVIFCETTLIPPNDCTPQMFPISIERLSEPAFYVFCLQLYEQHVEKLAE